MIYKTAEWRAADFRLRQLQSLKTINYKSAPERTHSMTRWHSTILAVALGAAIACVGVGCTTAPASTATANSQQPAIDLAYKSYAALDQAILAADAAVKAGTLKGDKARAAYQGFVAAKAGLDAAVVALKAASGATQ